MTRRSGIGSVLLLSAVMVFLVVGCSKNGGGGNTVATTHTGQGTAVKEAIPPQVETAEKKRVADLARQYEQRRNAQPGATH